MELILMLAFWLGFAARRIKGLKLEFKLEYKGQESGDH
jgi:hypothetical protein